MRAPLNFISICIVYLSLFFPFFPPIPTPSTAPNAKSRLASPEHARVQADLPDMLPPEHPRQEPFQSQAVPSMRARAVLALVREPVVRRRINAFALVSLQQLVLFTSREKKKEKMVRITHKRRREKKKAGEKKKKRKRTMFQILMLPPTISPTPGISTSTLSVNRRSSSHRGM
jgi:hypothetical protein